MSEKTPISSQEISLSERLKKRSLKTAAAFAATASLLTACSTENVDAKSNSPEPSPTVTAGEVTEPSPSASVVEQGSEALVESIETEPTSENPLLETLYEQTSYGKQTSTEYTQGDVWLDHFDKIYELQDKANALDQTDPEYVAEYQDISAEIESLSEQTDAAVPRVIRDENGNETTLFSEINGKTAAEKITEEIKNDMIVDISDREGIKKTSPDYSVFLEADAQVITDVLNQYGFDSYATESDHWAGGDTHYAAEDMAVGMTGYDRERLENESGEGTPQDRTAKFFNEMGSLMSAQYNDAALANEKLAIGREVADFSSATLDTNEINVQFTTPYGLKIPRNIEYRLNDLGDGTARIEIVDVKNSMSVADHYSNEHDPALETYPSQSQQ